MQRPRGPQKSAHALARTRRHVARLAVALLLAVSPWLSRTQAQDQPSANSELAPWRASGTREAAAAGAFLPWTQTPTLSAYRATVQVNTHYDSVRQGPGFLARAELVLLAPRPSGGIGLSALAGGGYGNPAIDAPSRSSLSAGLKLQVLSQQQLGFDLALAESFVSSGFNLLPAALTELLWARRSGALSLLVNLGYGQSLRDDDRFGSARAALTSRVIGELQVGADAKVMVDLERDADEPAHEPQVEAAGNALVSYAFQHVRVGAHAGPVLVRYRFDAATYLGALIGVSLGSAL
jgi:hypothetical protein